MYEQYVSEVDPIDVFHYHKGIFLSLLTCINRRYNETIKEIFFGVCEVIQD